MTRALGIFLLVCVVSAPAFGQRRSRRTDDPTAARASLRQASPSPRPLYERGQTWYEFMFHELNPRDVDLGSWYRTRREAFVNASVESPYFWYSLWVSLAALLSFAAYIKSRYDRQREKRIMGEQMDQVRAHDAYSRQVAREAIRQYNEHIELCNRAIEASGAGESSALGGNSEASSLRMDLDEAKGQISALEADKKRLEDELAQKAALVTDLSLRIDALSGRLGGNGQGSAPPDVQPTSPTELVRHINSLQQQLHAEREKNKRLKGGV